MHHADQGLSRIQVADDFLSERGLLDLGDEFLYDGQCNIRLEQSHAHFAQCILNVALAEPCLPAQSLDDAG